MAAAKTAAMTRPATPCGRRRTMNAGKSSLVGGRGGRGGRREIRMKNHAEGENQRDRREDDDPADDRRGAAAALTAAGEQPLHERLARAGRRHRKKPPADESRPERE